MNPETFIQKWGVSISSEAQALCALGLELLLASKDPTHDEQHVASLLRNADRLLEQEQGLRQKVNLEVLVLSIVWHDVWRAGFIPKNAVELLYAFLWDGMGSKKLFVHHAKKFGLKPQTMKATGYAIQKHHSVQFLPRKTLEAKILKDCDELELWSLARAKIMYTFALEYLNTLGMKKLSKRYLNMKLESSIKTVYFQTTARLLEQRMKVFLKEFDEEINTF